MATEGKRLWGDARRQQLLEAAARVLTEHGPDGVRIPEVAAAAGVTRPVVYRFFSNRQALLVALVEDFAEDLEQRFAERFRVLPETIDDIAAAVVDATCDAVTEKGPGAWRLVNGAAPDPMVAELAARLRKRLTDPWLARIRHVTGASEVETRALGAMLQASSRAILALWVDEELTRDDARRLLPRAVRALLGEFSSR